MGSIHVRMRRTSFTFTSSTRDHVFKSSFSPLRLSSHFRSLSATRWLVIVSAFIIGFTFTVIMRWEYVVWLAASAASASPLLKSGQGGTFDYPGLRFGADKKFSITVFSDLHLGEPAWIGLEKGPDADSKTIGVMRSVLDNEHSNMVVLNGDLTSCEFVAPENVTALIDQLTTPLIDRNIPFSATFGNHDMSKTCNTRFMSEHMWDNIKGKNGKRLSFTTSSVSGPYEKIGTSNYYIPIYSSSGGGNPHLSMMLWFFDSKGGRDFQKVDFKGNDVSVDDWVDDKADSSAGDCDFITDILRDAINQQQGRVIPSLAFVHIPPHATRAYQDSKPDAATRPGLNKELIGHQGDFCDSNNNCKYSGADTYFMKALVETEGLLGVFSGHDHGVDWCMRWAKELPNNSPANGNGLNFCFNRHSGYGGYSDWARGGRQIIVEEDKLGGDNVVETWLRLEDGSTSGRVVLNSTYGEDRYPVVADLTSTDL